MIPFFSRRKWDEAYQDAGVMMALLRPSHIFVPLCSYMQKHKQRLSIIVRILRPRGPLISSLPVYNNVWKEDAWRKMETQRKLIHRIRKRTWAWRIWNTQEILKAGLAEGNKVIYLMSLCKVMRENGLREIVRGQILLWKVVMERHDRWADCLRLCKWS